MAEPQLRILRVVHMRMGDHDGERSVENIRGGIANKPFFGNR